MNSDAYVAIFEENIEPFMEVLRFLSTMRFVKPRKKHVIQKQMCGDAPLARGQRKLKPN